MSGVSDEDRATAKRVLWTGTVVGTEERVAAALAAEREKARAPHYALLAELDGFLQQWRTVGAIPWELSWMLDRIRRAAEAAE